MQEICEEWRKEMKEIRKERRYIIALLLASVGIGLAGLPWEGLG